ncbi:MAG: NUDIX domain-containing protein [Bacillota bacterium]
MNELSNEQFHVGVYGILIKDGKILLIKKSRGAYKGMYDLPGGGIEFGERIEETLKREFLEETGINLSTYIFIGNNEYFCDYVNGLGEKRRLHHIGIYFEVTASIDNIKDSPDGQDSMGAELIELPNINSLKVAPIALQMINKKLI